VKKVSCNEFGSNKILYYINEDIKTILKQYFKNHFCEWNEGLLPKDYPQSLPRPWPPDKKVQYFFCKKKELINNIKINRNLQIYIPFIERLNNRKIIIFYKDLLYINNNLNTIYLDYKFINRKYLSIDCKDKKLKDVKNEIITKITKWLEQTNSKQKLILLLLTT